MKKRARWVLIVLVLLGWWTMPAAPGEMQLAMPPLIAAVAYAVAAYAGYITVVQAAIMIAVTVYGAVSGREAARRARNQARDAYNNSLADRTVNIVSTEAPWQIIYGEAVVGGAIVAQLTSGDKDQYKHVVIVWAAHECDAITDFLVNGVSVGSLDSEGYVTGGRYAAAETDTVTLSRVVNGAGQISLGISNAQRVLAISDGGAPPFQLPGSECTLTAGTVQIGAPHVSYWAGKTVRVTVDTSQSSARLRVRHHLGTLMQTADAATMADCPGDWTASDRGLGLCYSIIKLDLNEREFQGGPPQFTARIRGRKLYDRRTGTTAWSSNNALCIDDFLQAEWGKRALSSQIVASSVQATANVCDEGLSLHSGEKRYTCNGAFTTDRNPDATLTELCQSMAGFVTYTGAWHLQAGAWTAPVMDLGDAENAGAVEGVAEDSANDAFNGVRGQFYDPDRFDQLTDYTPYQNEAFVAADGEALWTPLNFPFTNKGWRAANLARIHTERSRGMTLVVPCKRVALKLRVGHRVRYSNSLLGISLATFRVVKRPYRLGQPVQLTLAQDVESFYDELDDAPGALPSPAVYQPNPWVVDAVSTLAASSGTATLQLQADGTVTSRVHVTFAASDDVLVRKDGALQVEYRLGDLNAAWQRAPEASGTATELWLMGLEEGKVYIIRARWRNGLGATGDWRSTWVLHMGKTEAPAAVVGLLAVVIPGAVRVTWTPCPDLDYAKTLLRVGASWAAGVSLPFNAAGTGYDWLWPALGAYTVWAVHVDSTGNMGAPVSVGVTVDSSIYIGSSTITPSPDWLNSNVAIPRGTMNADPGLLEAEKAWSWGPSLDVIGPSTALGALGVKFFSSSAYGTGNQFARTRQTFPISSERTYNLSALLFAAAGNDRNMYLFVDMYKADGTQLTGADTGWGGSYAGYVFGSTPAVGQFTRYGADFGAGTTRPVPAAAAYFRIGVWFQYSGGGSSSVQQAAEDIRLVDITEARAASVAAAAAQGTANSAATNASSALTTLSTMRSNGYLDAAEKPALIKEYNAAYYETGDIQAKGTAYGLTVLTAAYAGAYNALGTYLSGLSPSWSDTTTDTPITPAVDQAKWLDYYTTRQTLLNAIAEEAGKRAQWAQVGGTGKPLDNAGRTVDLGSATGVFGARTRDDAPGEYPYGRSQQFKQADAIGLSSGNGTYCTLETIIQYTDDTGGPNVQYAYQGDKTWRRSALRFASSWGAWTQDLDRNAYTGDLNATVGAPSGTYVAGQLAQDLVTTASTAASNAGTALANAGNALTTLATMRSNGYIDAAEKPSLIKEYNAAYYETGDIQAKGTAYGLTALTAAYAGAYSALGTYLAGLSPSWSDTTADTPITPAVDQAKWLDYYTTRQTLLNAIAEEAGKRAQWALVGGAGKPADNATRNYTYRQSTDPAVSPGGVVDGELWLNLSTGKAFQRVSGAWVPYVGDGSIGTPQLGNNSATDWVVLTAASVGVTGLTGSPIGSMSDVHSYTYVAPANGLLTLTADHKVTCTSSNGGSGAAYIFGGRTRFVVGTQQGELSDYGQLVDDTAANVHYLSVIRSAQLAITAGSTYVIKYQAQQAVFDQSTTFSGTLRIEALLK